MHAGSGFLRSLVLRAVVVVGAAAALVLARAMGGGAEGAPVPPRPDTTPAGTTDAGALGDGYEAAVRLVEVASDARFEMPSADTLRPILKAHWRQQKPPFFPVTGEASRFVTTIALRTSASETQWAMPLGEKGTKSWAPDARVWNMNEGSFDQREALVATTPGRITFKTTLPRGAKLTFAEGTINATEAATVFVVSVLDARGSLREVYRHALQPGRARRWTDASCDLSAYAGQNVELRLATETAKAGAADPADAGESTAVPESAYSGPGNGRASLDGGAVREDVLATPGAAVALWGNPTILARTTPKVPYNVLWVVVDALRPDVLASFHDDAEDAKKESAPWPPLEALLPKIPNLTPAIDALAQRGVRFTRAYSAGSWTRPGTLAMLAGARSTELGIDTTSWVLGPNEVGHFYASDPPLLSLLLRQKGVTTRAFVNNYFMVGYAPVGIEMGFERVDDHRYRTRDTLEVTQDATRWIRENASTRFFAFVNYNSPHEPYEPPAKLLERIPPPPVGPKDRITRLYMAEAAKDDEAIGVLMKTLDETGLRDSTLVVVTADHGETLSSAHVGTSGLDKMPIRYHHAVSNFEETTKVPILLVLPKALPAGAEVKSPVRTIDIAPTVLDVLGLEAHPRMSGASLLSLSHGRPETDPRVIVSEGRGSRAILHGRWRFLVREGAARIVVTSDKTRETEHELFDLESDPGERHDVAAKRPEIVAEMRARLEAALKNVPVVGTGTAALPAKGAPPPSDPSKPPLLRLRFAGGREPRRVSGTIVVGDARTKPTRCEIEPAALGRETWKSAGGRIEVAFRTSPNEAVGFDLLIEPPAAPVTWELWLDEKPWPEEGIFGGPFGLLAPSLRTGVATDEARTAAQAFALPTIDARRDVGLFVARERARTEAPEATTDEGAEEMARLLREWGYARGSSGATGK